VLAFAWLGSRGLFDPDEGRYTNVALTMLDDGDWVDPMRNEDTGHWTKPPLTYWVIASSVAVFGSNEWAARPADGARLPGLHRAVLGQLARRLAPGREALAALAYMTMLMPLPPRSW
jgi:4-amino-4-deoxy-L-arabinose transferase-like glycosyltransferase